MSKKILILDYFIALNIKNYLCGFHDINILIKKHLSELPFTNINLLLNHKVSLDLETIIEKIILNKDGGYCFEHNKLMFEALLHNGFNVKAVAARVLNNKNIEVAKTHRITILTYRREQYLIDVGFGFASPNVAVKFGSQPTLNTLGRAYQIKENGRGSYTLGILQENNFFALYSFDMCTYHEVDFEIANFYSYAHKDAKFTNNFVFSKVLQDKTLSLRNNSYYKIYSDDIQKSSIKSIEEFQNILTEDFDYSLGDTDLKYLYDNFVKKELLNS